MKTIIVISALSLFSGCGKNESKQSQTSTEIITLKPTGQKITVITPDSIKISSTEIKLQNIFNNFCETSAKIKKRTQISEGNGIVKNQYLMDNGGSIEAGIKIESVEQEITQIEVMSYQITRCTSEIVVVNPNGSIKQPVITPNNIKISGVEAEILKSVNEFCETDAKVIKRILIESQENFEHNQYILDNGGKFDAVIKTKLNNDIKITHIGIINYTIDKCSTDIVVLNPTGRKT